jgi:hypothetical protein
MRKTILLGAALMAFAMAGCHMQEPARSPSPAGDLEGVGDKATQGLDKNGSTIDTSGDAPGEKAIDTREEHPAPADKPQPPPPEPKP